MGKGATSSTAADHYRRALALAGAGDLTGARAAVDEALGLAPDRADALALKGALLTELGQPQEALGFFERSLAAAPNNAAVHSNQGNALVKLERREEAVESFGRALAINPGYAAALTNRAGQLFELGRLEAGLDDADRAVALNPKLGAAQRNRSRILLALNLPQEALASLDASGAADADSLAHRGAILSALGRHDESLEALDQAVARSSGDPENLYRRAHERLRNGLFEGGWRDHEARWSARTFLQTAIGVAGPAVRARFDPAVSATDLAGRSVLVVGEQGVGDQIMFASILPDLAAVAERVTCVCDARLVRLLSRSLPAIRFIAPSHGATLDDFDAVLPLASLGRLFRSQAHDFPGLPYLRPADAVTAAWRRRLGVKTTTLRVGLSWQGGVGLTGAAARSMALETLRPLLMRDDCEFVSLQHAADEAELAGVNATLPRHIRSFPAADLDDFEQLAGLVQSMDVVVSVQNTNVHVSGALGKTCLAMIPAAPEWRYGAAGETMPWYDSVRLLRQTQRGDWDAVVAGVGTQLDALAPVEAAITRAVALANAGKASAGVASLDALGPALDGHTRATGLLGTLMTMGGDPEAALPWFQRSLALNPLQPAVHADYGNALGKLGRHKAAVDAFDAALKLEPNYLPALNNRAGQRLDLQDSQGAMVDADRALAIRPDLPSALRYRSRALLNLQRLDDAMETLVRAEALQPENADNFAIRGAVATQRGDFAQAAVELDRAVALEPDSSTYIQSRSYARLRIGELVGGWADYERRWQSTHFREVSRGPVPTALIPRLELGLAPDALAGQRVLLVGEQGVGDQIMFASAVPDLIAAARSVTCVTSPRMQSLFESSFPQIVSLGDFEGLNTRDFDNVIAIGSLGALYRRRREDFPGTPYLKPRETIVGGWRERLGPKTTPLRVGISWSGGAKITGATARSLSLEALRPLLERTDCEFVSLQYGKVQAEVDAFNKTLARPILNFPREEIENFEALAGLVANLDLVVSVQTTLIHLCGAIGAPCLVMIPFIPEWRYGTTAETMPWYGSVRLLRQSERGDWAPVIAKVGSILDARTGATSFNLDALVERARGIARSGGLDAAIDELTKAGAALNGHRGAAELMSGLLLRAGRAAESLPSFDALIALDPTRPSAHADQGKAYVKLERAQDAVDAFGKALALSPGDATLLVQRGVQWLDLDDDHKALADFDAAMALDPPAALRLNLLQQRSRALATLERPAEALAAADTALALAPDNARSHYLRARALLRLLRTEDAYQALLRTVEIDPQGDAPRFMLGLSQLRRRDYQPGWANYERRWSVSWFLKDSTAMVPPALASRLSLDNAPEDFDGRSILIIAEQGVGDHVMFASILPDVLARAKAVTFVSVGKLMSLLQASFPAVRFIPPLPSLRIGDFDRVVPLGSLPRAFRNDIEDFPGAPYLAPRAEVAKAWRDRLGQKTTRLRVGISWQGGTDKTSGQKRSIPLEQLRPLLEREDCEFVSLQYGDVEAEVAAFNATLSRPIRIFPKDEIEDFEALAALVLGLDLVVSVQTAIIHLSGAVGAPCLVMIPFVAEWRYGAEGETMPWYRSVRLVRQTQADDWSSVIARIAAELDARAEA